MKPQRKLGAKEDLFTADDPEDAAKEQEHRA
jgi:hypothetical protein